jgi:hypothetical protein
MLIWPAELPPPTRNDYSLSLGDNRRFTQGDAGPPRLKGNRSKPTNQVAMSIIVSRNGRARFERFLHDTDNGALPFLIPDHGTHGWGLATEDGAALLTEDGAPMVLDAWFTCRFGQQMPGLTPVGVEWKISFNLLVYPR